MAPVRDDVQLVWFRDDLRTHDHPALAVAAARGPVAAVAVLDPDRFRPAEHEFPRQGGFFARFRLEALADLRRRLRALGGELAVRLGRAADVVPEAAAAVGARAVHATMLPCTEERAEERRVRRALEQLADPPRLELHTGATLVDPDAVPTPDGRPPRVFTTFRRLVEKRVTIETAVAPPDAIEPAPGLEAGAIPSLGDLGLAEPPADDRGVLHFRGGETAGLERIETWMFEGDHLRRYKETRNGLLGEAYSSKLSAWLAHGCLGPRTVHDAVRRYEAERIRNDSTHWLLVELLWRDFFHHVARDAGPRLFRAGGLRGLRLPWSRDEGRFAAWREGRTGVPMVDASMRELAATGYMSNRGRQVVASFLAKNLGLDWRLGAAWFESLLIDHDPASNYGNWTYVAGVGNDAREFRWFDPISQAERYDPDAAHARTWLPERDGGNGDAAPPAPIVDVHRSADDARRRHEIALAASDEGA